MGERGRCMSAETSEQTGKATKQACRRRAFQDRIKVFSSSSPRAREETKESRQT